MRSAVVHSQVGHLLCGSVPFHDHQIQLRQGPALTGTGMLWCTADWTFPLSIQSQIAVTQLVRCLCHMQHGLG